MPGTGQTVQWHNLQSVHKDNVIWMNSLYSILVTAVI